MKIDSNTKISEIINSNPKAIDAIGEINKHFIKLKNPFLRKMLAPRVTIADAAKIGGVEPQILLEKLAEIGFSINKTEEITTNENNLMKKSFENKEIVELDARPELEKGIDPFKSIMKAIKDLEEGKVLKIINTFEPIPLIKIISEKGFDFMVERDDDGLVYTYFTHTGKKPSNKDLPTDLIEDDAELFESTKNIFENKLIDVDVRQLEMPLPMVTILQAIEELKEGHALFVHHKRIPQFLLKELEERGYNLIGKKVDEANTKLLIYKK